MTPPRRSSVATPPSRHQLASPVQEPRPRSRSPSLLHRLIPLTLVFEVLQWASSSLCSPKECCYWRHKAIRPKLLLCVFEIWQISAVRHIHIPPFTSALDCASQLPLTISDHGDLLDRDMITIIINHHHYRDYQTCNSVWPSCYCRQCKKNLRNHHNHHNHDLITMIIIITMIIRDVIVDNKG